MQLYKHPCPKPNIGDEFNDWFWLEVFGEEIQTVRQNELLVGIGTVLSSSLPQAEHYHIVGSGTGYGEPFDISSDKVNVHFVRGPLTAKKLGLPASKAITDPAILIAKLRPQNVDKDIPVSVMTHVGIDSDEYRVLVEQMGWTYISPSDSEASILSAIARSEVLITSAMHGAIMADSYRVPWVPIITSHEILHFKWQDWCDSMQVTFTPNQVSAYWSTGNGLITRLKKRIKKGVIQRQLHAIYQKATPSLSSDEQFSSKLAAVENALHTAKQHLLHRDT